MERIRVLLVDDEPLARDRLRAFLHLEPEVEIIGECASGPEAITSIREHQPDLVFLDLQLPGCHGLAVAGEIPAETRPAIVFVTAHMEHAVDAFQLGVVDYLLKPFDRGRLQTALRRAQEHLRARHDGKIEARLQQLLDDTVAAPPERPPERFAVRSKGRIVFIRPDDVVRVEAADNYSTLRLASGEEVTIRESLAAVAERLGTVRFARVNRSTVVAIKQIKELRGNPYGDYTVILRDGSRVPLSRSLRGQLDKLGHDGP